MTQVKKTGKTAKFTAIILAAGKGTRMNSPLPKVLHPICGKPMITKVIKSCQDAGIDEIRVVLGHGGALVRSVLESTGVQFYMQAQQLGTGDAVRSASPESIEENVLILNGDHPLIESEDLRNFMLEFSEAHLDLAVVTCILKKPGAFGRIIRHQGGIRAIVEAKDASMETLKIKEVNTGIYLAKADVLQEYLPKITNKNAKNEFYLTDVLSLAVDDHCKVEPIVGKPRVAFGVNSQVELARANKILFQKKAQALMESGVLILDPSATYVENDVEVLPGSVLYPNVYLRGKTRVGSFTSIEPNCYIVDSTIGESVVVKANTYIEKALVKDKASLGPFARLRPETEIGEEAQVGNFVEMKKVKFGKKSKAAHLTYLGDAEVGVESNIGCGTITCNYAVDRKKYKTIIGDHVFVGSDTQFVAPIKVGNHSVIGSGSTITKDVPERALAVARGKQHIIDNYVATSNEDKKDQE